MSAVTGVQDFPDWCPHCGSDDVNDIDCNVPEYWYVKGFGMIYVGKEPTIESMCAKCLEKIDSLDLAVVIPLRMEVGDRAKDSECKKKVKYRLVCLEAEKCQSEKDK